MTDAFSSAAQNTFFTGRRLHLGICGSVACYKMADVLRAFLKMGLHVSATLTDGARQFVTPGLFEALGAMPVYVNHAPRQEIFGEEAFAHLEPGQRAGAMLIAPATADALARLAAGRACDMLSAQALAFDGPLLAAPAMNPRMWANAATQENVAVLRRRGVRVLSPDTGGTACGDQGQGRLAPPDTLLLACLQALAEQDMAGRRVLVTLGPTREPWDGVRFWSNPSSGRMGAALATAAWLRGASVDAVCGPGCPPLPPGVRRHDTGTARDMFEAARALWPDMDMGAFSAAVADFSPVPYGKGKFKKEGAADGFSVTFTANPDILRTLSLERREGQKVLGFAAETVPDMAALMTLVRGKRERKRADLLAGNAVNAPGCGFGTDSNSMAVMDRNGHEEFWTSQSKADVAWKLWSWLLRV